MSVSPQRYPPEPAVFLNPSNGQPAAWQNITVAKHPAQVSRRTRQPGSGKQSRHCLHQVHNRTNYFGGNAVLSRPYPKRDTRMRAITVDDKTNATVCIVCSQNPIRRSGKVQQRKHSCPFTGFIPGRVPLRPES